MLTEDFKGRIFAECAKGWENELSKKRLQDKELKVTTVEKGIILPTRVLPGHGAWGAFEGGVCDNDFNFVAGDRADGDYACVKSAYTVDRKDIVQLDEDVIYGGALHTHFGHFLTECWNRLWFVVQKLKDEQWKDKKVVFVRWYNPEFDEFFKLMGIEKERIIYVLQKPMQFRSVTVPDQAQSFSEHTFTKEFMVPYQAIKSRVTPGTKKKVYLTRREVDKVRKPKTGARCFNEEYFENFFAAHGFEIVSTDTLPSIEEEISLIMGADEIATTSGTLAHWVAFAKPNVKFIMLLRTKDWVLVNQCRLMEAFNISNYYIVDGSHNLMYASALIGSLMLGPNKYWKEFVLHYFNEQIEEDYTSLKNSLNDYVDFWYKVHGDSEQSIVNALKELCQRVIALEEETIKERSVLTYQTHVHNKGWGTWSKENQISNELDKQLHIEAIKVNFPTHKVYYSVYFSDEEGWSEEVTNSEMAGTTGKAKPIYGMRIWLGEEDAREFDILYRVHKFDDTWTPWVKNGEALYSYGQKLNAIQIKLENKA